MSTITISPEQSHAIELIVKWMENPEPQEFFLGGYAGTGKTTVIKTILSELSDDNLIEVATFTGKAASVLQKKGVDAGTIHSLIYKPKTIDKKLVWQRVDFLGCDLLIIDEASMISRDLYEDLKLFGTKILWVGDPGQLEPVGEDIGLMKSPTFTLSKIFRQAENSPILDFATFVREGGRPREFRASSPAVSCARYTGRFSIDPDDGVVLCGFNKTRVRSNKLIRSLLGRTDLLVVGEKVICLSNDGELGVFNGQTFTVKAVRSDHKPDVLLVDLTDDIGRGYDNIPILISQFHSEKTMDRYEHRRRCEGEKRRLGLFDYAYSLTTHKSQGSEWNSVVVIEEIWEEKWSSARWRYTAVTRAAKELTYFHR